MQISTSRFGIVDVADEKLLRIENGLIGFPGREQFVLLEHRPGSSLHWLQSADDPGLAFVVANPLNFFPDYVVDVSEAELEGLELSNLDDLVLLVVLTIRDGGHEVTANMIGPILLNASSLRGRQLVLDRSDLSTRQVIVSDEIQNGFDLAAPGNEGSEVEIGLEVLAGGNAAPSFERAR